MSKIKIEDIKEELAREGWELLSDNYKNLEEEMTFKCLPESNGTWCILRDVNI